MRLKIIIVVMLWAIAWAVTYAANLADLQRFIDDPDINRKECRHDMGGSMFFALLPPVWVATFFATGFYEHGFQFTCEAKP